MTDFETIRLDEADTGIATLTLARPDKHNALNAQMIAELTQAAHEIAKSETIRVVIWRVMARAFAQVEILIGCANKQKSQMMKKWPKA